LHTLHLIVKPFKGGQMPEILQFTLEVINVFLAFLIFVLSIANRLREKRKEYKWLWTVFSIVGVCWTFFYMLDLMHFEVAIMGYGVIRSIITITLGAIVALLTQLRIPRRL